MMAELYCDLDADVIALQEYTEQLMRRPENSDISSIMEKNGYAQVYKHSSIGSASSATPIFYKADKFELVESEVVNLMTKYPGCGGDKYMTIAVLKEKSSGKIFGVISLHMDYRYDNNNATNQATYNSNRVNMAKDACNKAALIQAKYSNCPIFIGGDFNSTEQHDAYNVFLDKGYVSARDMALKSEETNTHGPGPYWDTNSALFYTDLLNTSLGNYKSAIDHVMIKAETNAVGVARYDVLIDTISASISDHFPQVVDFNLN